jgi:hypothetical protein
VVVNCCGNRFTSSSPVTVAAGNDQACRATPRLSRADRARRATDSDFFSVKLRKSDGGPFFHKLVQTNAPGARKFFEPPMFDIRQPDGKC